MADEPLRTLLLIQDKLRTGDEESFRTLLHERQHFHVSRELVALRDDILAPRYLAHLRNTNDFPNMMIDLVYGANEKGNIDLIPAYRLFSYVLSYVHDVAYGDAVLRFKGLLPPVAKPFTAPLTAALDATSKSSVQHIRKSIAEELLATLAPEQHRTNCLEALEGTTDVLNQQFALAAKGIINNLRFPNDEVYPAYPLPLLGKAMVEVGPLSEAMCAEAQDASATPSMELLEKYRVRGAQMRYALCQDFRGHANEGFTSAAKLQGKAKAGPLSVALNFYFAAAGHPELADVAHCNGAATALLQENYQLAIDNAEKALLAQHHRLTYPDTYKERRAAAAIKFQNFKAKSPLIDPHLPLRARTDAQVQADNTIAWKAHCRKGRGYAGLCLKALRANDAEAVRTSHVRAAEAFRKAFELDSSNQTPLRDLEALERKVAAKASPASLSDSERAAVA